MSQSCLSYLHIALQTSLQADSNRESLRTQILNEKVNESLMREELGIISREHQRQTRPLIETYLEPFKWKIDVVEPDHPDIAFTKSFDVHLDLLWFLIPMFLFRRIFKRHFIAGIPKEVEINLSRLAYQWEKSVNAAIEAMKIQAVNYVLEELTTIEALLSQTQGQSGEIQQLIVQLQKQAESLIE